MGSLREFYYRDDKDENYTVTKRLESVSKDLELHRKALDILATRMWVKRMCGVAFVLIYVRVGLSIVLGR